MSIEDEGTLEIPDDDLDAGLAGAWEAMKGLPPLSGFVVPDPDSSLDIDEVLTDEDAPRDFAEDRDLAQAAELVERSGRYRVHHELGRGGMGLVLGARDRRIGRFVAIKLLHEVPRQYRHRLRRFVEEAQIAGQLQHPSIVPVYDVGVLDGSRPFFTMKYVKGETLADALGAREHPTDDIDPFLDILGRVAEALSYAHSRGVVHRDLKPSNVMLGTFGEVLVTDWGLAKVFQEGEPGDSPPAEDKDTGRIRTIRSGVDGLTSMSGSILGTPAYMAPEQGRGDVDLVDARADVFALGGMLCEVLTGGPPNACRRPNPDAAHTELQGARDRVAQSGGHPELVALSLDCLSAEIEARPAHAGIVSDRLKAYRAGLDERARQAQLAATTAEAVAATERRSRRRIVLLSFMAILSVLVASGAWVAFRIQAERRRSDAHERVRGHQDRALELTKTGAWASAVVEAERARQVALTESLDTASVRRAGDLVDRLQRDHREALRAADFLAREQVVVEELERLRVRRFQAATRLQVEEEYFAAFASLQSTETDRLADFLPHSQSPRQLIDGLLDWAVLRRYGFDNIRPEWWQRLMRPWRDLEPDRRRIEIVDALLDSDLQTVFRGVGSDLSRWDPPFLSNLMVALRALGEHEKVLAFTNQAALVHPHSYALRFGNGLALTLTNPPRWAEAIIEFTAADTLLDDRGLSAHNMGVVFAKLGRDAEAARAYRRAAEREPNRWTSRHGLALCLINLGQLDDAEALTTSLAADVKDDDRVQLDDLLGTIHYFRGRYGDCIPALDRCLAASPDRSSALFLRGSAHLRLGQIDAAIADLQRLREVEPGHWRGLYRLGTRFYLMERYDEALVVLGEAAAANPRGSAVLINLGQCLVKLGRPEEALGYLLMGQKIGAPRGTPIESFIASCRAAMD